MQDDRIDVETVNDQIIGRDKSVLVDYLRSKGLGLVFIGDPTYGGRQVAYRGIAQDLADFPAMQALSLSTYPHFSWTSPRDLPEDYFSQITATSTSPVLVIEVSWPSPAALSVASYPQRRARWIAPQAQLQAHKDSRPELALAAWDEPKARAWISQ